MDNTFWRTERISNLVRATIVLRVHPVFSEACSSQWLNNLESAPIAWVSFLFVFWFPLRAFFFFRGMFVSAQRYSSCCTLSDGKRDDIF